mmetsp:Transcript_26675/g.76477  ORF Transcript_26675/g.76477 Transcript_26675/m.76477 type:complete len:89 (-) Transcript_26675:86-352(-)
MSVCVCVRVSGVVDVWRHRKDRSDHQSGEEQSTGEGKARHAHTHTHTHIFHRLPFVNGTHIPSPAFCQRCPSAVRQTGQEPDRSRTLD